MALKDTLLRVFTWWSGPSVSLEFYTKRGGSFVDTDDLGNRYYRPKTRWQSPCCNMHF